jgi:hypothetical protein
MLVAQRITQTNEYRPQILRPQVDRDATTQRALLRDPQIDVHDTLLTQLGELVKIAKPRQAFNPRTLAAAAQDRIHGTPPARYAGYAQCAAIMMLEPPCTLDGIGSNPDWESLSPVPLTVRSTCDYEWGVDCTEGALRDLLYRRNARQGHDFRLGLAYECRRG